jgi:redox-regulated HSP33 family molecular chaperone
MFSETVARSMVRKAHANYEDNIKKHMSSGEVMDDIASLHKTIKNEEIERFRGSIKLGGDTLEDISIQQLEEVRATIWLYLRALTR